MELTRDELWLLEVTALSSLPISLLFSHRLFLEEMNLPFPDSAVQDIVDSIVSLGNRGLMKYEVSVEESEIDVQQRDVQELEARLEKFLKDKLTDTFGGSPGAFANYYSACGFASITPAGGEAWEEFAEPDWGQPVWSSFNLKGTHTFKARTKQRILEVVELYGEETVPGTEEWTELRPWSPTRWKVLDSGWTLRTQIQRLYPTDTFHQQLEQIKRRELGTAAQVGSRRWYENSVIFNR